MATKRLVYGVTLDQIDALDRLVRAVAAQGDAIAMGRAGELDSRTVPSLGQAIYDSANLVRSILDDVEAQPIAKTSQRTEIGETRGTYGVVPIRAQQSSPAQWPAATLERCGRRGEQAA